MHALINVLDAALTLLIIAIIVRAVLSWINPNPHSTLMRFIDSMTDPILAPIQKVLPNFGGIDISPIIAILIIQILREIIINFLLRLS